MAKNCYVTKNKLTQAFLFVALGPLASIAVVQAGTMGLINKSWRPVLSSINGVSVSGTLTQPNYHENQVIGQFTWMFG